LDGFRGNFAITNGFLMPVDSPHPASIRIRGRGDRCNALFLGNLFWAPVENVWADAIWKNEVQPPAKMALVLCNLNGQVKGAKDSALDSGGFGRLSDRETKDDAALIRQTLAPLREALIWLPEETRPVLTDLLLYRVRVSAGKRGRGVVLLPGKAAERRPRRERSVE
jgi:hypothetical protein